MAPIGVDLKMCVSEPDALTTRPPCYLSDFISAMRVCGQYSEPCICREQNICYLGYLAK